MTNFARLNVLCVFKYSVLTLVSYFKQYYSKILILTFVSQIFLFSSLLLKIDVWLSNFSFPFSNRCIFPYLMPCFCPLGCQNSNSAILDNVNDFRTTEVLFSFKPLLLFHFYYLVIFVSPFPCYLIILIFENLLYGFTTSAVYLHFF